jgi:hypothetical protein
MKKFRDLFPRKKKAAVTDEKGMMSISDEILKIIDNTLLQIFIEHKLALLENDPGYVIQSVCGPNEREPLNQEQMTIHNQINPAIHKIYDMLKIEKLSREQKQTILFFIRFMMVLKILFMIELYKNNRHQKSAHKNKIKNKLEEMEACGHA